MKAKVMSPAVAFFLLCCNPTLELGPGEQIDMTGRWRFAARGLPNGDLSGHTTASDCIIGGVTVELTQRPPTGLGEGPGDVLRGRTSGGVGTCTGLSFVFDSGSVAGMIGRDDIGSRQRVVLDLWLRIEPESLPPMTANIEGVSFDGRSFSGGATVSLGQGRTFRADLTFRRP